MKVLKAVFAYLIWILIALILGVAYMRILLGENNFVIAQSGLFRFDRVPHCLFGKSIRQIQAGISRAALEIWC